MKLFRDKGPNLRQTLAAAIVCAAMSSAAAYAKDWKFSSSVNYDTGKYGTPDRINSVYVPFALKRYYRDGAVSVTVPYLRQSSTGQITRVDGQPVRVARGNAILDASAESGLGDILVRGAYTLTREKPQSFDLALACKVKLPTGDKNKGLGTGKTDWGAGLEFAKEASPRWTLLADGYYTFIGDPVGINFKDQIALDMGFTRALDKSLALTVLYETRNALVNGNANPASVSGTLSYSASGDAQFFGGLALGLSNGSPDAGVSAGFSAKF